jgi:hypothetical protein
MLLTSRFRFDHEPGDTARNTMMLERFKAAGLELGAEVTVYECRICNTAIALFDHTAPPAPAAP